MAQDIQRILIKYEADIKELRKDLDGAKKNLKEVETTGKKSASSLTSAFKGVAVGIAAAFSVQVIKSFLVESTKLADQQLKAEAQLLTALKGRRNAQRELIKQAAELQKVTTFGDEVTIQAQARIAAFVQETDQIKELTRVSQDFAAAKGIDLAGAAELITKTFASSTNALSRYGLEVEGAALSSERLDSVIKALDGAFKGQAEVIASVGLGPVEQLSNAFGDLQEEIGKIIIEFLPDLTTSLNKFVDDAAASTRSLFKTIQEIRSFGAPVDDAITDEAAANAKRLADATRASFQELVDGGKLTREEVRESLSATIAVLDEQYTNAIAGNKDFIKSFDGTGTAIRNTLAKLGLAPDGGGVIDTLLGTDGGRVKTIAELEATLAASKELLDEFSVAAAGDGGGGGAKKATGDYTDAVLQAIEANFGFRQSLRDIMGELPLLDTAFDTTRADILALQKDIFAVDQDAEDAEDLRVLGVTPETFNSAIAEYKNFAASVGEVTQSLSIDTAQSIAGIFTTILESSGASAEAIRSFVIFQKFLAIAEIAINLQKEISAIAANPLATLQPDFGATTKGIAIAAAVARAGLGTATVLATSLPELQFAKGTSEAPGGMALVGEEGPEIMHVPKGARVFTANASKREKSLIDAINEGSADEYIRRSYVDPALTGFAKNLAQSAQWQYDDFNLRQAVKSNKEVRLDKRTLKALQQPNVRRYH